MLLPNLWLTYEPTVGFFLYWFSKGQITAGLISYHQMKQRWINSCQLNGKLETSSSSKLCTYSVHFHKNARLSFLVAKRGVLHTAACFKQGKRKPTCRVLRTLLIKKGPAGAVCEVLLLFQAVRWGGSVCVDRSVKRTLTQPRLCHPLDNILQTQNNTPRTGRF